MNLTSPATTAAVGPFMGTSVVSADTAEAETVLPPPSATNPVPVLPAALRIDNYEQLMQLLQTDPHNTNIHSSSNVNTPNFRQWLVFGSESLRTLLLRNVLCDPHSTKFNPNATSNNPKNNKAGGKTKNWEGVNRFIFPSSLNIVGTNIVLPSLMSTSATTSSVGTTQQEQQQQQSNTASKGVTTTWKTSLETVDGGSAEVLLRSLDSWDNNTGGTDATVSSNLVDVVTYFLRPHQTQDVVQRLLQSIGSSNKSIGKGGSGKASSLRIHHRLVFLPQANAMVYKQLQQFGILPKHNAITATTASTIASSLSSAVPNITIHSLQLDLFPLETDIISLEYENALAEANDTPSALVTTVARSLLKLQDIVGSPIPRIQTYGPLGEEVLRKLFSMTLDEYIDAQKNTSSNADDDANINGLNNNKSLVDAMVLIDRRVDNVTPMLTPLTYEGLLDEVIGIDCGFLRVHVDVINPEEVDNESENNKTKISNKNSKEKNKNTNNVDEEEIIALGVNGSDSLYAEVRDQHVEKFGSFLQNQALALRESHANFTNKGKKKDLSEIHQFVKQIPVFTQNLRSLTNHIHLAELIKRTSEDVIFRERWQTERSMLEGETCYNTLDDLVASQISPFRFFRLLCLQSLCSGGIKSSRYDSLRRDVVQTYGYEYLFLLQNLEKSGFLRRREGLWMDSASPFYNLRKSLVLINAEVDTVEPDDISYVSSGYAPLSVRLIQTAIKGWQNREDILRELPGRHLDVIQQYPPVDFASALEQSVPSKLVPTVESKRKPTLIVVYIGGITYMEIAALRFLSKRSVFPYHIIVLTTKIINGSNLVKSISLC